MGPPSYMRSFVDQNFVIRRMTVFVLSFSKAKDLHRSSKVMISLTIVMLYLCCYLFHGIVIIFIHPWSH